MAHESILQNIGKHINLDQAEQNYFISLLTEHHIERKSSILQEGQLCDTINYVQAGALRAFYRDDQDNESIIMFAIQDWWITDMYSFASEKPAMLYIDALEDSVVLQLQKKNLEQLYIQVPKFEKFFRILMQNAYIREQLRVIQNLSMPAAERYENFLRKYPQFVNRVPLKQIASYLGITPEFLSVLRKKASKG
jgi:CRP-like cAMP-binding protein